MPITVLNYSGRSLSALGLTERSRAISADNCRDYGIVEGLFADLEAAEAFARRKLHTYYIASDDVTGDYLVFSHAAA